MRKISKNTCRERAFEVTLIPSKVFVLVSDEDYEKYVPL